MRMHNRSTLCGVVLLAALIAAMPLETSAVSRISVVGGTLDVGSTLSAGDVVVGPGATLGGSGTIVGDITMAGILEPAVSEPSPAVLTVDGDVHFVFGSAFLCRATSHTENDRLSASGTVGGTCTVEPDRDAGAVPVEQEIISAGNGIYVLFSLPPGGGYDWRLEEGIGEELLLTSLTGDSDGNGLPDWFELEYFAVRTGTDPGGHADDDGMTNEEEWIAGTDPTDTASWFGLNIVYLGEDDFRVEWPSVEGRLYSLYFGEDVDPRTTPIFEDMTAQPPTNSVGLSNWSVLLDTTFIHGTVRRDTE